MICRSDILSSLAAVKNKRGKCVSRPPVRYSTCSSICLATIPGIRARKSAGEDDVKNRPIRIAPTIIPGLGILMVLLPTILFGNTANAQWVTVQFLNGRNGKPIAKGGRVWVYFNNETGRHILDLHTDGQGEVQFDANGAKTFQVSPVGYIPCGEQPVGSSPRDYAIDEILKTGLLTKNDCGPIKAEPIRRRLLYFARRASWWELFKN
jgi:hypothetical protein